MSRGVLRWLFRVGLLGGYAGNLSCTDGALRLWDPRSVASDSGAQDTTSFDTSEATSSNGDEYTRMADSLAPSIGTTTEPPPTPLLVDDFEDGDTRAASGLGWWYTQSDTTGEQTLNIESPSDAGAGARAAHYSGFGFQVWGALLGLDFTPDEGHFDASSYSAMHFRARVGEGSVTRVSARLLDPTGQFVLDLELTNEWAEYALPFASLVAVDGGSRRLDASRLTQLHLFVFSADYFDLWLDDFELR